MSDNYDPTPEIAQAMMTLANTAGSYGKGSVHWYLTGPQGQRADVFVVVADDPLRREFERVMREKTGGKAVDRFSHFTQRNGVMRPMEPQ